MSDVLVVKSRSATFLFAKSNKGRDHIQATYMGAYISVCDVYVKLNVDVTEDVIDDLHKSGMQVDVK